MPYIHKLFNYIFDSGIFPSVWSDGLLIPLYKKGSTSNPDNFRGITLLSTLGKLFTRLLNSRYDEWAESYRIYVEAQYGFRAGRGTVDCIYILHSAINNFIESGKALYTLFVDFSKAFDRVVYDNLWYKLIKLGIHGKIFDIVKSMYSNVKTRVFSNGTKSDPFPSSLGVRQGECLSPFLFSMYVNDLEYELSLPDAGIDIGHMKLLLLMYADDVVLFANSAQSLQAEIDKLRIYCDKWKLRINVNKTVICVFRKGTRLPRAQWKYGDVILKVTNKITYLGLTLSSNGIFTMTQKVLSEQATKAAFLLNQRLSTFRNITPELCMHLFDKFVSPVLNYGSEVWGFHPGTDIETVHLKFCKRQLQVKASTQNDFVYGELCRYPMHINRYCRIIRYWLKIVMGMKSQIINNIYMQSIAAIDTSIRYSWVRSVRKLLFDNGFGEVWYNQGVGNLEHFYNIFRTRLKDIFKQNWNGRLSESSRADLYRNYKRNFELSPYLEVVTIKSHRVALTRLLTSSHRLRVESARWERPPPPRHQRLCNNCKKLDDEYHFVIECKLLLNIRVKLIPKYYWEHPSMFKFLSLINTDNKIELVKLAEFAKKGFDIKRKSVLYPDTICILSYLDMPHSIWH